MSMAKTSTHTDSPYLGVLKNISFQPVFIMGDHRSGTTLLYQMLDATQCFNVVRAYHVIKYDEIVSNYVNRTEDHAKKELSDRFAELGVTDRMIDGVGVTPDLPEEYGFILDSTQNKAQLSPENLPRFIELCKKLQYVSDPGRPLLLKNPWDFLQFMYVKQALPAAKFIFIHREPIQVINSQLRAIRSLVAARNAYLAFIAQWYREMYRHPLRRYATKLLFCARFDLGLRITSRHVARGANYFLEHVDSLPQPDHISIRYEDLCTNPGATVKQVLDFLGLKKSVPVAYERFIAPRPIRLLPEVARRQKALREQLRPYYVFCGYDLAQPTLPVELPSRTSA